LSGFIFVYVFLTLWLLWMLL